MGDYIKVSKEAFAPIAELVRIGLFKNEKDALTGIIREQAKNKIGSSPNVVVKGDSLS